MAGIASYAADAAAHPGQPPLHNGIEYRPQPTPQLREAVLNPRRQPGELLARNQTTLLQLAVSPTYPTSLSTARDRAMFAYDFICREPIGICRTAELVRFEDGLIRDTELFFDARPLDAIQRAQAARATTPGGAP